MRIDRKLGLCVMICTGILTGCYPGNKPQTNENSAHSVDMEISLIVSLSLNFCKS